MNFSYANLFVNQNLKIMVLVFSSIISCYCGAIETIVDPTTKEAYRVESELGYGNYGVVYQVVSPDNERLAIKVIKDGVERTTQPWHLESGDASLEMIIDRTNRVDSLQTSNDMQHVLPMNFKYLEVDGVLKPTIVSPVAQGHLWTPEYAMIEKKHLTTEHVTAQVNLAHKVMIDIFKGINELAKQGLAHNDMRPKNIFLYKGKYVLADFDLTDLVGQIHPQFHFYWKNKRNRFRRGRISPWKDVSVLGCILSNVLLGERLNPQESTNDWIDFLGEVDLSEETKTKLEELRIFINGASLQQDQLSQYAYLKEKLSHILPIEELNSVANAENLMKLEANTPQGRPLGSLGFGGKICNFLAKIMRLK